MPLPCYLNLCHPFHIDFIIEGEGYNLLAESYKSLTARALLIQRWDSEDAQAWHQSCFNRSTNKKNDGMLTVIVRRWLIWQITNTF